MCTPTEIRRQVEKIREKNYEKSRWRRDLGHDFWFYLSELKLRDLKEAPKADAGEDYNGGGGKWG